MPFTEIQLHGFQLHYEKRGGGTRNILVFHGYGQEISIWKNFLSPLEENNVVYYFHLFGHGKSLVNENALLKGLNNTEWQQMLELFLRKEMIQRFSLIAYSLGAKLGLLVNEYFAPQIDHAIYLAPDGVKPDYAQIILIRNKPGRLLLNWFHRNPALLNYSLGLAKKVGAINHRAHQYFLQQTQTIESRNFVLQIWYAYRKLRPNIERAMMESLQSNTAFYLFYGTKDSLINKKYIESAIKKRPKELKGFNLSFQVGHNLLTEDVKEKLVMIFKSAKE